MSTIQLGWQNAYIAHLDNEVADLCVPTATGTENPQWVRVHHAHTHIYALSPTFTFIWHLISLMSETNNKKLSWANITSTRARIYCRLHNPRTHVEISSQAHKFSAGWMRKAMPVTKSTLFLRYTVLAQIGGEKTHPLCGVLSYMISYLLW